MTKTWHLRFSITSHCNFTCVYCNPDRLRENRKELSTGEILQIVKAGYKAGIRRIHWTGGEPTLRHDFLKLLEGTKKIGYQEQILTTNGWNFYSIADKAIKNGLTRVNISLDTLSPVSFKNLTGTPHFHNVKFSLRAAAEKISTVSKINTVVMRSNLDGIMPIINFVKSLNRKNGGRFAVKLICINPNNPAMLNRKGQKLYYKEVVDYKEIISLLERIGAVKQLDSRNVVGDNPNSQHFLVDSVMVEILAMPSWNYRCAKDKCKKLRITPFGEVNACLQDELISIKGKKIIEQVNIIKKIMKTKCEEDSKKKKRKHYRPQIGEVRFGKVASPMPLSKFK